MTLEVAEIYNYNSVITNTYAVVETNEVSLLKSEKSSKIHSEGLSAFKGFLLVIVIIIHIFVGDVTTDFYFYFLHSIAMPLTLASSGYLLNQKFLKDASFKAICKKYYHAMLKVWGIALLLFYTLDTLLNIREFSLQSLVDYFLFPRYHFWYIGALFVYILGYTLLKKIGLPNSVIFFISIVFALWSTNGVWENYRTLPMWLLNIYTVYKPFYAPFFFAGILTRDNEETLQNKNYFGLVAILGVILRCLAFNYHMHFLSFDLYFMNFILIIFLFPRLHHQKSIPKQFKFLDKMGRYSLYIYLFHALPMYIIYMGDYSVIANI